MCVRARLCACVCMRVCKCVCVRVCVRVCVCVFGLRALYFCEVFLIGGVFLFVWTSAFYETISFKILSSDKITHLNYFPSHLRKLSSGCKNGLTNILAQLQKLVWGKNVYPHLLERCFSKLQLKIGPLYAFRFRM